MFNMEGEQRPNQVRYGMSKAEGITPFDKKKLALGMAAIMFGSLLTACGKTISTIDADSTSTQPAITETMIPPTSTEYVLPGVSTETVPTQVVLETPPPKIDGVALVLPGIEPGAGGPDLIKNPLTSILQNAINAAGFGVVGGENVSSQAGQSCITAVPEKLWSDTLPNNEQRLKDSSVTDGVAKYDDTKVLAQVSLPADTEDATFSCALGYAVDNPDYKDGTLRQLLVKTNKADGSQEVIASMQAGFSTTDNVEVKNGAVLVNGETQGWTAQVGMELPAETIEFKAGIPATMEECNAMDLQVKADGTINRDALKTPMQQLSAVEHQWLIDKGITIADVPVFYQNGVTGTERLPYPHIDVSGKLIPTSCTKINYQGHEYVMYGFAGKHSETSTQIAIFHVIYDDLGNKLHFDAKDNSDYYSRHYTSNLVFEGIQTMPAIDVHVFVGGYGQSDNPEDIERWQMAKAINEMNKPVRENNRLIDEQLSLITDQNTALTPEEEQPWIETVEQSVFAAQTIIANDPVKNSGN